ncbi:MAG: hypothetical protein ACRD21_26615, partial [Vicinamibacteria bacterium]
MAVQVFEPDAKKSASHAHRLDGRDEVSRRIVELDRALEGIAVPGPDPVTGAFAGSVERPFGEKTVRAHDTAPRFGAAHAEGRFRPGHDPISTRVMLEVVAKTAKLDLPTGARRLELVIPLGAGAEAGVDESQDRFSAIGLEEVLGRDLDEVLGLQGRGIEAG